MNPRRNFLRSTASSLIALSTGVCFGYQNSNRLETASSNSLLKNIGPLLPANKNGLMLPAGFTSRVIAKSSYPPLTHSSYNWHGAPDGGATFTTHNGGWIYVSNCELGNNAGGVGALVFDAAGKIINAYSILENSNLNCAGGHTPWKTWLSCEETSRGLIWECDPYGQVSAVKKPALGRFAHEATTVDTKNNILYLTEDRTDGCLYRFIPSSFSKNGYPNLDQGSLEVAIVNSPNNHVQWEKIPDPSASSIPTRYQIKSSTTFNGGEGIVYYKDSISFATKGDNRIWTYNTSTKQISIVYNFKTSQNPILSGVDNITLSQDGELVVSEDGGDLQIIALLKTGQLIPLLQLTGHNASEITGPAFSPDGKRLYFSSQRGTTGLSRDGITFEVSGPFHR